MTWSGLGDDQSFCISCNTVILELSVLDSSLVNGGTVFTRQGMSGATYIVGSQFCALFSSYKFIMISTDLPFRCVLQCNATNLYYIIANAICSLERVVIRLYRLQLQLCFISMAIILSSGFVLRL